MSVAGGSVAGGDALADGAGGFDPVLVEIVNNELGALSEEMAIVIWKTGRSPMLKTGDFATALCDPEGNVVAEGFAAPFQLAIFETFVSEVAARYGDDLAPGDVFISNDPFAGMTHLPDIGVVAPAFSGGVHVGYAVCYSHHSDIGGRFPGGMSEASSSVYEEGIRIPIVKLFDAGVRNETLLATIRANVRAASEWMGDLDAKVAGCRRGVEGLAALNGKFGHERFAALGRGLVEHGERAMRRAIAELADGEYSAAGDVPYGDEDGDGGIAHVALTLRVAGDALEIDLSGSSDQVPFGINTPHTMVRAAICGGLKALVARDVPANSGFFRPVKLIAPEGSIVNPTFPAPVSARAPVFFRIFDLLFRVVAQLSTGTFAVPGVGGDAMHLTGTSAKHGEFAMLDLFFGGWGARSDRDGIDGVAPVYMGSYGSTSVELLESQFPLTVEEFGLLADSEGAGRFRGSLQIVRAWRLLEAAEVMVRSVNMNGSPGMGGGGSGPASRTDVVGADGVRRDLPRRSHVHFEARPGDHIRHVTAGSGGFAEPTQRDPALVAADVAEEKVSIKRARDVYAVELDPASGEVDWEATARVRGG